MQRTCLSLLAHLLNRREGKSPVVIFVHFRLSRRILLPAYASIRPRIRGCGSGVSVGEAQITSAVVLQLQLKIGRFPNLGRQKRPFSLVTCAIVKPLVPNVLLHKGVYHAGQGHRQMTQDVYV